MLHLRTSRASAWIALVAMLATSGVVAPTATATAASGRGSSKHRIFLMRPVTGSGANESASDRVAAYVETLMSIDDRFELVAAGEMDASADPDAEADKPPEIPADPAVEKADERFAKARGLARQGKMRSATKLLKKVIGTYAQRFMYMEDFNQLIEAVYEASMVFHETGLPGLTMSMLGILFTLRPDTVFDRSKQPPEFLSYVERARGRIEKTKGAVMKVKTRPPGARVLVDGVDHGGSPVEVPVAVAGSHFVVARLPGHRPDGKKVKVSTRSGVVKVSLKLRRVKKKKKKKKKKARVRLDDIAPLVVKGRFDSRTLRLLRTFAEQGRADFVVVSHVRRSSGNLIVSPYIFSASREILVPAEPMTVAANLSNLQIALLASPDKLAKVMDRLPVHQAVRGVPAPWRARAEPIRPPKPSPRPAAVVVPPPAHRRPATPPPVAVPRPPPTRPTAAAPAPVDLVEERDEESGPVLKQWWFWLGAAALIGSGVAGAMMLSSDEGSADTFSATVRWR